MEFYYRRSDQQFGPMPWEALVALARDGSANPTDLVWAEGWESWQAASAVPDLLFVQVPLRDGRSGCATAAGYFGLFTLAVFIASPLAQALLPVRGADWAAGAGFLGLLVLAPLALLAGMLAVVEIKKHSGKHGMGRASFAIVIGGLGTCILLYTFLSGRAQSGQAQSTQAQNSEWKHLDTQAESLYNRGQYDQALVAANKAVEAVEKTGGPNPPDLATSLGRLGMIQSQLGHDTQAEALLQRVLTIREKAFGPESPLVAESLNNLGHVLHQRGRYALAESRYLRALAIYENAYGPEAPDVAAVLNNLALLYVDQGRYVQAEPLYQRALAILEKAFGPEHPNVATDLDNLASLYVQQGKYTRAKPLYLRALAIDEKLLGAEHPDLATDLNNLASLYDDQGQYDRAEPLYQRALAIREKALGPEHPKVAASLGKLASLYDDQAQYHRAEPLYQRALAIDENAYGPVHPNVATDLNGLASLYVHQGQYTRAEPLFQRALEIYKKAYGPEHPDVAAGLTNLATLHSDQGQYALAEPLYQRALAIDENVYGREHPQVAAILNNLGLLYVDRGQSARAEPLYRRALAINEKAYGPEHPKVATDLNNLALLYQPARAEPLFLRALAINEKALGPMHPDVAAGLNNLALLYVDQGQSARAEPLFQRVLAINEKALGPEHPRVATDLNNLAARYIQQGQFARAEPLLQRALAINEKALGPLHPSVATDFNSVAWLYDHQGRYSEALTASRRATAILRARFVNDAPEDRGGGLLAEQRSQRGAFLQHLAALSHVGAKAGDHAALAAEGFEVSQLERASSVGQSVAQMAARFAQRGDALAALVRAQQDTRDQLASADKRLLDALGQPPDKRSTDVEGNLHKSIDALGHRLDAQNKAIAIRFPQYQALVSQAPVSAADVQKLLHPDEALLVYTVADEQSYAWVVRPDRVSLSTLAIGEKDLDAQVQFLRRKLQPNDQGALAPMTPASSSRLYQAIFAPLEPSLVGVKRVLVVPEGALQSLPFGVLGAGDAKSGQPEWLARRYAFAVLPSVSALRALRTFSHGKSGSDPFAGFGDPVLKGEPGSQRGLGLAQVFTTRSIAASANASSSALADVEVLRKAPPLPETADELKALSATLHGSPKALFLQAQATEARVKQTDLSHYRFLAFATHGVMAGELSGPAEPGLVLTPPLTASALDDGYLSASEVAQLKLNADWVLLSACNTASPDGSPGAEGLSGLAKAFFYAGSRSLLVSNWPVASKATQVLITATMKTYAEAPDKGKPEALRSAMLEMMDQPEYSHPFFWAPFSVVGE